MSQYDEFSKTIDRYTQMFKDATDEIARDLDKLRKSLADNLGSNRDGLTATEAEDLRVKLDRQLGAAAERLTILGQDPENPIPGMTDVAPAVSQNPGPGTSGPSENPTPNVDAPKAPVKLPTAEPGQETPSATEEVDVPVTPDSDVPPVQ